MALPEDIVGRDLLIPGASWEPAVEGVVPAYISKKTDPSVRFPTGRYEVVVPGHKNKYMFEVNKFDYSWVQPTSNLAPKDGRSKTPSKRAKTPSKARTSTGTEASPGTARTPSRGRARVSVTTTTVVAATPGSAVTVSAGKARRASTTSPARARTPSARQAAAAKTPSGRRVTFKDAGEAPGIQTTLSHEVKLTNTPRITRQQNFLNALLMVAVGLPAAVLGYMASTNVVSSDSVFAGGALSQPVTWPIEDWSELSTLQWWQRLALHTPLAFVNLVFLLNVDIGFWLVALWQGNTWLIDPYWAFLPCMIQLFYQMHPLGVCDPYRGIVAGTLLRIWALRITHSYLRREEWQFGAREDWRFTELGRTWGEHWWWMSFFATYISQHLMLVGITLPFYAVYNSALPWSPLDAVATLVAASGIAVAWAADTQLRQFMVDNEARKQAGLDPMPVLNRGLWRYSRHPNYFGEQMFWWGLALYAVRLNQQWLLVGPLFNSLCMVAVTKMTEDRMAERPWRRAAWEQYKRTTSMWVPWFKGQL